jgi:hypothetical protein
LAHAKESFKELTTTASDAMKIPKIIHGIGKPRFTLISTAVVQKILLLQN